MFIGPTKQYVHWLVVMCIAIGGQTKSNCQTTNVCETKYCYKYIIMASIGPPK